jgi:site-specific DNA-methyltransferase (adenine-specific)
MTELAAESTQLMVTSPPYFNAPFDYDGFYSSYDRFLEVMRAFARESYRVLQPGRIAAVNCDDMLVGGEKYPVVADLTRLFLDAGFRYRDKIIWRKPDGYVRISRRSGVMLQHPFPMYFYPDNLQESILIFQKGKFDYKSVPPEVKEASRVDVKEYNDQRWHTTVWEMTNRLPHKNKETDYKYPAAFPEELPRRVITLYSFKGETVLDPFMGSGTTAKVARELGRNSVGYELDEKLRPLIEQNLAPGARRNGRRGAVRFVYRRPARPR